MANLRIDTTLAREAQAGEPSPQWQEVQTPTTPRTKERVSSTANALLPHVRRGNSDKSPLAASNSETLQQTLKALHESKKLLSTSLDRLRRRQMPPPTSFKQTQGRTESQGGLKKVVKSFSGRGRSSTMDKDAGDNMQRRLRARRWCTRCRCTGHGTGIVMIYPYPTVFLCIVIDSSLKSRFSSRLSVSLVGF